MKQQGVAHRLEPPAVTALAPPIVESALSGKDPMIRFIVNRLVEPDG